MTRLPMAELQATLDRAAQRWPDSPTLADFRADPALLAAELAALAAARHWITPHSEIARLAGDRAIKLDWHLPETDRHTITGDRLLFPAATLGRKGAWELRDLAKSHPITICGAELEEPGFWDGIEIERQHGFDLDGVRALVLPAWVENQPRRLLQAIVAGVPVIASDACGLAGIPGVTSFPPGDIKALQTAIDGLGDAQQISERLGGR